MVMVAPKILDNNQSLLDDSFADSSVSTLKNERKWKRIQTHSTFTNIAMIFFFLCGLGMWTGQHQCIWQNAQFVQRFASTNFGTTFLRLGKKMVVLMKLQPFASINVICYNVHLLFDYWETQKEGWFRGTLSISSINSIQRNTSLISLSEQQKPQETHSFIF